MDKTYNPELIEEQRYQFWEQQQHFAASGKGTPYCIMIPPPNVTGSLHMGHGFGTTLMDILIRYHRMLGDNTLWQVGTDHAGIATQMVVERQLLQVGQTRHDLGREAFLKKVWEWKNTSGGTITKQFRRLGASVDWQRECFTMDEHLSATVRHVFIQLYREGLIYRGERLVNWDPKLLTAISDLEVISNEEEGHLWHITYPVVGSSEKLIVATTRPETLLGDVAVAVHPDDARYQHLIGQKVELPLTGRTIPIIADSFVDPEFGTGCVKITPGHDFNDYAVGTRHQLKAINIFTPDAHLNDQAPAAYRGLERFAARAKIVKDLEAQGLLVKIDKHTLKVPRGDRSGVVVEPYLTQQWFMHMKPLAEPALTAVAEGKVKFIPENWTKTYNQWLENIEDWCISRQLWWGHRIPAWYDQKGNCYVGENEADVRKHYQLSADLPLSQDDDVLDTWFSSALWPFSTLGWPEETPEFRTFYPTNVLVTGFDIIFFWVARMIMMGLKLTGDVPFRDVFITGLIRDADGQKMSKSKGNVLDPIDLIDGIDVASLIDKRITGLMQPQMAEKIAKTTRADFPEGIKAYGTDALRFTFCALASYGREIRFDVGRLEGYRNFCNKLWNAARYVFMNTEGHSISKDAANYELSLADRWIVSRLQHTIAAAHAHLKEYRFDLFAHSIYEFIWNEYCDWYLELSKPVLYNAQNERLLQGTRLTLLYVLEHILRLLHPIMPFITDEIWLRAAPLLGIKAPTIMSQPYPKVDQSKIDQAAETDLAWLQKLIVAIRTIRSEMNIAPSNLLPLLLRKATATEKTRIEENLSLIQSLARIQSLKFLQDTDQAPESATAFIGDLELLIPMAGLINKAEESQRLLKEISKIQKDAERAEAKLQNPSFIDKAPPPVVAKEQEKLAELKSSLQKLQEQLEKIQRL